MQTLHEQSARPKAIDVNPRLRLEFLDALRGIGAVMVVLQHVGDTYSGWIYSFSRAWFNFGRFGVTVFFLVSGFVIPYAFEKHPSVTSFWIKRFFRLYPLYWFSLVVTVAVGSIYPQGFLGAHYLRNILANITMLQGFAGIPNASEPYWTLTIEMAFYFAFTAFFLTRMHKKTVAIAWIGIGAFSIVCIVLPLIHRPHSPVTTTFCFVTMLTGAVYYRYFTGEITIGSLAKLLLALLLINLAGVWISYSRFAGRERVPDISVFLSWLFAFLTFSVAFSLKAREFPSGLLWLGRISYSLYLLHAVALDLLPRIPNRICGFITVVCVSVIFSAFSYRYVERPFIALGRRIAAD